VRLLPPELIPTRLVEPADKKPLPVREPKKPPRLWFFYFLAEFLRWLTVILWLRVPRQISREEYARRVREFLESMGGLWIQAGQLLALRRDLFSKVFCDELLKLTDHTDGFPMHMVRQIVEEEIGGRIEDHFDEFIEEPFAASSIGQLHMAHTRIEQVWVAVKVQRPWVREHFDHQLRFIRLIFGLVEKLRIIAHLRSREIIGELVYVMAEKIDYRLEASNIRRMRRSLKRHKVYVPKVFFRFSSRRVLVMEYIQGALMTDYIAVRNSDPETVRNWEMENNIEPRLAGRRLHTSLLRQVLEDNLFHGDLHPGNIVLLRNSQLAFIDFGTVGFMESEYLQKYTLFLRSLASKEYSKAADVLFLLGSTLPAIDTEEVKERLIRCFRAWETRTVTKDLPYEEKSLSTLYQEVLKILYQYRVPSTWLFLKVERTNLTLDASLKHLYPTMNYPDLIRRYFRQAQFRELVRTGIQITPEAVIGVRDLISLVPEIIYEFRLFQAPVIRRHAQLYQGQVTKIYYLLFILVRDFARLIFLSGTLMFAVFLQQKYPTAIEPLIGERFRSIAEGFPQLDSYQWLLLLVVFVYVYLNVRSLRNRLSEKEVRLPEGRTV
jgi:ubiquinone biosynthesis protein